MDRRTTRRDFLRTGTALSGVAAVISLADQPASSAMLENNLATADDQSLPIVDTHQHLWDLKQFKLPWIEKGTTLDRDFVMSHYLEATKGLNVVKSVYMEVDVAPEQQVAEAEFVIDVCRRGDSPMVGAIVSGRPSSPGFKDYILRFKDAKEIKGLRQVLHGADTPRGYCLSPEFVKGIRFLGERGLSYDICIRPEELADADALIKACPDTSFILDHCGNANVRDKDRSAWKADIEKVARNKNVACKVSGIVASAKGGPWTAADLAPIVNHVLDTFGPDRVVFGGDWPVCTLAASYREWVEALREIVKGRSLEDRKKLFQDNAIRVYRLS